MRPTTRGSDRAPLLSTEESKQPRSTSSTHHRSKASKKIISQPALPVASPTSSSSSWRHVPWSVVTVCYNKASAWLFPNEPEPLDMDSTLFFIAQVPFLIPVVLTWFPRFLAWLFGFRTSEAGDRGRGPGMRKTWTVRLALAMSFLKTYLFFAEHLTIEACQSRSRSIPFMTAPGGVRVNKVKIPTFPYRSRAEAILYECLSEEERQLLRMDRKTGSNRTTTDTRQMGLGLKVNVHRTGDLDQELINQNPDSDSSLSSSSDGEWEEHQPLYQEQKHDPFEEGLDAEWLEYIGEDEDDDNSSSGQKAAVLYLHGGGYYTGSKEEHRVLIGPLVKRLGKNIRILTINYRLAPQYPFPAALVDALSSYMWLMDQSVSETFSMGSTSSPSRTTPSLHHPTQDPTSTTQDTFQPHQIVFMGDSAGGGLAISLSLLLRDYGDSLALPQPRTIVTWSPWLDLTQSLPSFKENALTDCIPYENFVHQHSEVVDKMFEHEGESVDPETGMRVRQRAQAYCPDSQLRMKYVSPLFEKDFSGIPTLFITCGSAERFANECVLMAARMEEQRLPCRIDIHEDMPHIFPLFRFHTSSKAALDRTCLYIREMVNSYRPNNESDPIAPTTMLNREGDTIIPIGSATPSRTNSPALSSAGSSPALSSNGFEYEPSKNEVVVESLAISEGLPDRTRSPALQRPNDSTTVSILPTLSTGSPELALVEEGRPLFPGQVSSSQIRAIVTEEQEEGSKTTTTAKRVKRVRTAVNVIDLSGQSVTSFHKRTRPGIGMNSDYASASTTTKTAAWALADQPYPSQQQQQQQQQQQRRRRLYQKQHSSRNGRRYREGIDRRDHGLTVQDLVSDATLYEWEILLTQGYVPTRHWPLPPNESV